MASDCPLPSCDGSMYYDTCQECGHRETPPTSQRTGGAGSLTHPLSDEDYKREMKKLTDR